MVGKRRNLTKASKSGWIVLGVLLALLLLTLTPQCRAAVDASLFVTQVLPSIQVKPLEWVTAEPDRRAITFPLAANGDMGFADLYTPGRGDEHGAVLLFLGVNPAGRDDERVVNLASALARLGIVVMVAWSERLIEHQVSSQEVDALVAAFQYLQSVDGVDAERVGMAGFCVGASLLIVAAQDERIRDDVSVVNAFGPYYDAKDLAAAVLAERRFYADEETTAWRPDALTTAVVRVHLLDAIPDADERVRLSGALAAGTALPSGLSDDAQSVAALLGASDLDDVRRLLDSLPPHAQDRLRRISPSSGIDNLRAHLLVMHDRNDRLVPSEESRRLVDAVRARDDSAVHYTEFTFFDHVDPTRPVSGTMFAREGLRLAAHMYRVMRALQ